jgi:hypothetical protein
MPAKPAATIVDRIARAAWLSGYSDGLSEERRSVKAVYALVVSMPIGHGPTDRSVAL